MKLGSLFDGSGGFPLGAVLNGIEPVWASEIEPFPIRVTTRRFPNMKHYGNVAEIDGSKVEPVDIITFGSPCQDMSIAGKRAGLDGSRSNLFYEAVRIIKEMRKSTNGIYPRYAVWENVAGAFSSNKGEDFRCILEAMCRISDEEVYVPSTDKWQQAGCILGGHYSVAWRTFDAQYWGVPQRRKRIYLVADFAGECASEILFKPESVSWHTPKVFQSRQTVAGCATDCVRAAIAVENHPNDSRVKLSEDGNVQALTSQMGTGGEPCVAYGIDRVAFNQDVNVSYGFYPQMKAESIAFAEEKSNCLVNGTNPGYQNGVVDNHYIVRRLTPTECARLQGFPDWWCDGLESENPSAEEISWWANAFETHRKVVGESTKPKTRNQIIKWLKNPHSDTAEYKMWGNGVALPCVDYVLRGIAESDKNAYCLKNITLK